MYNVLRTHGLGKQGELLASQSMVPALLSPSPTHWHSWRSRLAAARVRLHLKDCHVEDDGLLCEAVDVEASVIGKGSSEGLL